MLFLVAELLIDGTFYSIKSTCRYLYNWYYSVDEKGDIKDLKLQIEDLKKIVKESKNNL